MSSMKINFGSIGGRRCVSFKVTNDGLVVPSSLRLVGWDYPEAVSVLYDRRKLISGHEAFRRWKTARKAWRTRKRGKQLLLNL